MVSWSGCDLVSGVPSTCCPNVPVVGVMWSVATWLSLVDARVVHAVFHDMLVNWSVMSCPA